MQGQLNQKPIIKIIRQLSEKKANGLLRVTRGKTIKAIFFEAGNPIFAISNSAQEQIEYKLLQEKLVSESQIEQARTLTDKPNKIGAKLIEIGAIQTEVLQTAVRDLVKGIIFSLFDWEDGEYVFDEKMRAAHEIKLGNDATEILLDAGRQISKNQSLSQSFLPAEMVLVRTTVSQNLFDTGKLVPVESYILSRIDTPTAVHDVGILSGLPDEEAFRALCALVASGFLKSLHDHEEDDETNPNQVSRIDLENLKQEVVNKTTFFSGADYYEILDVTGQATTAEIKAAYYNLAKKFHPDRFRQVEYVELRHQLESMFAKITQAYETLSTSGARAAYDARIKKEKKSSPSPKVSAPLVPPIPIPVKVPLKPDDKLHSAGNDILSNNPNPLSSTDNKEEPHKVTAKPAAAKPANQAGGHEAKQGDNNHMAERYYQQGRSRIEKKDYSGAIQLLREAVKLEPGKSHYHFYLGSALIRSPRNRREAEDHLSKAAKLDQFNTNLRIKIGMLFKESGNKPKAEIYFKDALSLDPDNRIAKKELRLDTQSKGSDVPIWKQDVGSIAKRLFKR